MEGEKKGGVSGLEKNLDGQNHKKDCEEKRLNEVK